MFARVITMQLKSDKLDEAVKNYKEIGTAAKAIKGFNSNYLLIDRETGKAVSVAFWDSEEDAIVNEQSGYYQEQLGKFKGFFTAPPVREGYEVSIQA